MYLGGLERIVGSLKLVYTSEATDFVSLNFVNESEVLYKPERLSKEISFPSVDCDSKVPEGLGINAF